MEHGGGGHKWWIGGLGATLVVLATMTPAPAGGADLDRRCGTGACQSCHHIDPALSHPVNVVPTMRTPPHLVLVNGTMTCITCHGSRGPDGLGVTDPALDRGLCMECHDPVHGGLDQLHAATLGRAHLLAPDGARASAHRPSWPGSPDAESQSCLECHDGALARAPGIRSGPPGPISAARMLGGRHPIGVEQRPRGVGDNLLPAHMLDARIRLFDGRVGCGSCHNPYADNEALLVMANESSALCLSCHDF